MCTDPLFSVIIPVYNRADFLRQAVESVLAQQNRDYEVIIIDDGSTEPEVQNLIAQYKDRVRFYYQMNQGQAAARNRGANLARGQYLAFLDSDDIWYPDTLMRIANVIQSHNRPSSIIGCCLPWNGTDPIKPHESSPSQIKVCDDLAATVLDGFLGAGTLFVRRSCFLDVGGFQNVRVNAEDLDLIMRISAMPGCVRILFPPTLAYRRHNENTNRNLSATVQGLAMLLNSEESDCYPATPNQDLRKFFILRCIRNHSLEMLRSGHIMNAYQLYCRSLISQLKNLRIRYVLIFPLLTLYYAIRKLSCH